MNGEQNTPFDLDKAIAQLQEWAHAQSGVIAMYLFGSHAHGSPHASSDVDLAIVLTPNAPDDLGFELRLTEEISGIVGHGELDVAILNRAPLRLRAEVLMTGQLLACIDNDARILFEARTMAEWWDFKPVLDRYDQAFFTTLKENFTDEQRREYQRTRKALATALSKIGGAKQALS